MKIRLRFILPLILVFLTLFLLFFLRVRTVNPLWKDWRVLAVETSVSEQQVLAALQNSGVGTVVSASSKTAAEFPNFAIESIYGTQFSPLLQNEHDSYTERLSSYFFDLNRSYRLYYLPNNPAALKRAEYALEAAGGKWGMDEQSVPPIMPPLLCAVFSAALLYFAKKRAVFACLQLPFLLLAFLTPAAAVCVCVSFTAFAAFCAQGVWKKHFAVKLLKKNLLFVFICASALLSALSGGFFLLFLVICAALCSASSLYLYNLVCDFFDAKKRFKPVIIRPARKKDFSGKKLFFFLLGAASCTALVLLFFGLSGYFVPSSGIAGLSIPAPARYAKNAGFDAPSYTEAVTLRGSNLPSLADFVRYCWNSAVFPYERLYEDKAEPQTGDSVVFPRFKVASDGKITESAQEVLVFDTAFILRLVSALDKTPPSIEHVLRSQERFFSADYTGSGRISSRSYGSLPISVIVVSLMLFAAGIFLYRIDKWLN